MKRYGRRLGYDKMKFSTIGPDELTSFHGKTVIFSPTSFSPDPVQGMREVANFAHYKGLLGFISFYQDDGNWNTVEGSAVLVGPGIALTAWHVLEELKDLIVEGQVRLILSTPTPDGGRAWFIRGFTRVTATDAVILSLSPATKVKTKVRHHQAILKAVPPSVGELVMISGFRAAPDVMAADQDIYFPFEKGSLKCGLRLFRSVGRVVENEHANASLVQVNVKVCGGMSGGAAFGPEGQVFGILSTSMDHGDDEGTAFVQPIWRALGTPFDDYYLGPGQQPRLIDIPSVLIDDRERVRLSTLPGLPLTILTLLPPKSPIEAV